jgi:hypothetical protein
MCSLAATHLNEVGFRQWGLGLEFRLQVHTDTTLRTVVQPWLPA